MDATYLTYLTYITYLTSSLNQQLTTKHRLIVIFCLWHMFAVGAYLLPTGYTDTLGFAMKHANRISAPYVLSLSQWQKWDIFSPDPLRRITDFELEVKTGDEWTFAKVFTFESLAWHERAKELKVLGRLEYGWERLIPSYLASACGGVRVPTGTPLRPSGFEGQAEIRLVAISRILPKDLPALRTLSNTNLETSTRVLGTSYCRTHP